MSSVSGDEIKIYATADGLVLEFGNSVSQQQEQEVVDSFLSKGFEEVPVKDGEEILAETSLLVKTDFDGDGESPYSTKARLMHAKKLRDMDRQNARGVKPTSSTGTLSPRAQIATANITPKQYIRIRDVPGMPGPVPNQTKKSDLTPTTPDGMNQKQREGMTSWSRDMKHKVELDANNGHYDQPETLKWDANGQWKLDKSNYGKFQGGSQYSEADNAKRKMNNAGTIDSLGNMGRQKVWGKRTNASDLNREVARMRKLSRKEPVKTYSKEEIASLNAAREAAGENKIRSNAFGKSEDLIVNQLKDLLLNKSTLGPTQLQPTNEEMFGQFVVTEEQANAAKTSWENAINGWYAEVSKPVEKQDLSKSWGSRGPIDKETLTEEEERIRSIQVDPRLTHGD